MDDLISRAALLKDLSYCPFELWQDEEYVKTKIMKQHAVDAAPVVHGQWKAYSVPHWTKRFDDNGDPEYKCHNEYVCSICRRRTIVKENFCPTCGARMDGD